MTIFIATLMLKTFGAMLISLFFNGYVKLDLWLLPQTSFIVIFKIAENGRNCFIL
jgi:hypothetical protein